MKVVLSLFLLHSFTLCRAVPPVIDIGALFHPEDATDSAIQLKKEAVGKSLVQACKQWGFFHVVNHNVTTTSEAFRQAKIFFAQPLGVKLAIKRSADNTRGYANDELTKQKIDLKEVFDFGYKPYPDLPDNAAENIIQDGFNQWPEFTGGGVFRAVMEQYTLDCARLVKTLVSSLLSALELDEVSRGMIEGIVQDQSASMTRLNYYPPPSSECLASEVEGNAGPQLGISRHTDSGILTVLSQDEVPGLEVYSGSKEDAGDGEWVPVDPVPGALTINAGDMLQVWSNDRLKAAEHRVRASSSPRGRYSIAYFFFPIYSALIAPLPALSAGEHPKYKPISWAEFRALRFQGDYANVGTEVQIEHYRL